MDGDFHPLIVNSVILFDGECNFCNAGVDFVIRNDRGASFQFAAIQSDAVRDLLQRAGISPDTLETVILWEDGQVYTSSTAVLRIVRNLRFPWCLLSVLIMVPLKLREAVYVWVARHRYRWFGKRNSCRLPNPEERARFLE